MDGQLPYPHLSVYGDQTIARQPSTVGRALEHVFPCQFRISVYDILGVVAVAHKFENELHRDTFDADSGFAGAHLWINRNAVPTQGVLSSGCSKVYSGAGYVPKRMPPAPASILGRTALQIPQRRIQASYAFVDFRFCDVERRHDAHRVGTYSIE